MNVLLSSVSRKVSLARTWHLGTFRGRHRLIVADMNPDCVGMHEGDDSVQLPALDSGSFKSVLKTACFRYGITLVVPTRDEEVLAFADWKDEFARDGILLLAPSKETVTICQDKIHFTDWCKANGFKVAKVVDVSNDPLAFPLFLRSRRGKGGSAAVRVVDFPELLYYIERFGSRDTLAQEHVRAPEYSVDVYAEQDGRVIAAVPRQRVQIVGGESWVSTTVKLDKLQAEAVRMAQALKLTGHAVMQAFVRDGEVLWIEVNPRFGGASALAFEAGCRSVDWLLGEPPPPPLAPYEVGLTMLRYTQDRFVRKA